MSLTPESDLEPSDEPQRGPEVPDVLARESRLLVELAQLADDRAAAELRVEAQYQAASKSAQRAFEDGRVALATELEIGRRDLAGDYGEQRQHALARYERESAEVERELAELQADVAREFDKSRRKAERKLKETRWEADTLYEASKDIAPRQLKEFEEVVESWQARVRQEHEDAQNLLIQWGQPWSNAAQEVNPEAESGGWLPRLQERVNFVIAERQRLAGLRIAPLAASYALLWPFGTAGIALAVTALAPGWGAVAAAVLLVLGFAVGLAACLYLRRLSRQQIDAIYPRLDQATLEAEALAQSALEDARARAAAQQAELLARREAALRGADEAYAARIEAITERRDGRLSGPVLEYPQKVEEITARRDRDLELAEQMRARRDAELRQKEAAGPQLETRYTRQVEQIEGRYLNQWQALGDEWQAGFARIESLVERIWSSNCPAAGRNWLADLGELAAGDWQAAAGVPPALRFGTFRVELSQIPHGVPHKSELAERGPTAFTLPALVAFPDRAVAGVRGAGAGPSNGHRSRAGHDAAAAGQHSAGQAAVHDHRSGRLGRKLRGLHAPGRLQRSAGDQPHLDRAAAHRGPAGRSIGTHGERDPKVSPQRVPVDRGLQPRGGRDRRAVPLSGGGQLSGQLQRGCAATLAVDRRQRAALRGLPAAGSRQAVAAGHRRVARRVGAARHDVRGPRRDVSMAGCRVRPFCVGVRRAAAAGRGDAAGADGRPPCERSGPRRGAVRDHRAAGRGDVDLVGQERHRRAAGPRRRHALATPEAGARHLAARARGRQNRLGQVDAVARPGDEHRPARTVPTRSSCT